MIMTLDIQARDANASLDDLRSKGFVPAVFYGPKEKATPIAMNAQAFERLFKTAGETTIIALNGVGDTKETLVRDVQFHPITAKPLHVDFYVLEKGKKVEITVPLEFVGEAPAEKAGHILVKAMHEVEIEVAPAELPHHLEVDLSKLVNVGDHILASQIPLPKSAELKTNADEIVVSVTAFEEEAAPVAQAPAEAAPAAPEKTE